MQVVREPDGTPPRAGTPVRTCVGCRRRDQQDVLLRVVAVRDGTAPDSGWRLVPDPRRRLAGRGASVHPDPECVRAAVGRNAFGRALRLGGRPSGEHLLRWLEQHA